MSPLFKKTSFRLKKIERPLQSDNSKKRLHLTKGAFRGIVALALAVMLVGIIYSGKLPIRTMLNEGDIATADIFAPFDFTYQSGIDSDKTEIKRQEAASEVADIYVIDDTSLNNAISNTEKLFLGISVLSTEESQADSLKLGFDLEPDLSSQELGQLLSVADRAALKLFLLDTFSKLNLLPITLDKQALIDANAEGIYLYDKHLKEYIFIKAEDIFIKEQLSNKVESYLQDSQFSEKSLNSLIDKLVNSWFGSNLVFSDERTDLLRKEASNSISPIYMIKDVSKGEAIIRKGQRVIKDHILQLDRISSNSQSGDGFSQIWGIVILILLLVFTMYIYLKEFEAKIFAQDRILFLIGLLILFAALSARVIVSSPLPSYSVPVASVAMLLTLLVGGGVAAITVIASAIIVALIAGVKFNIFLVALVGGIAGICTIYKARKRSQIIRAGFYAGALSFVTICALGIITKLEFLVFLKDGLWGIASGIASAAITMILLPVLEGAFHLTTDIRLLELSDLNHPLLKEMVTNATGTYHHSLIVGNLAEAAADSIGANSLLVRIGSYYHDIGKVNKSEYFAENKKGSVDVHQGLTPSMSSLIITNHVKDGIELAQQYKLGDSISDIIEQHHGAGLVTFFYHQAIEKQDDENPVSEEAFRYQGPKPQTKESAIVMLADSVEAASRVLQSPTPQRLTELVRKIINNKFLDRQLDECELTLKDISLIAGSFVKILTGTYHSRVEYPENIKKNGNNGSKRSKSSKAKS